MFSLKSFYSHTIAKKKQLMTMYQIYQEISEELN